MNFWNIDHPRLIWFNDAPWIINWNWIERFRETIARLELWWLFKILVKTISAQKTRGLLVKAEDVFCVLSRMQTHNHLSRNSRRLCFFPKTAMRKIVFLIFRCFVHFVNFLRHSTTRNCIANDSTKRRIYYVVRFQFALRIRRAMMALKYFSNCNSPSLLLINVFGIN